MNKSLNVSICNDAGSEPVLTVTLKRVFNGSERMIDSTHPMFVQWLTDRAETHSANDGGLLILGKGQVERYFVKGSLSASVHLDQYGSDMSAEEVLGIVLANANAVKEAFALLSPTRDESATYFFD